MSAAPHSAAYDALVADLFECINLGRGHEELLDRVHRRLRGVVPCDRVALALLQPPGDRLRLVSCRSDGEQALKVGYEDPVEGSTLAELLRTGQPRILNDLAAYLDAKPSSRSTRLIVREGMRANLTLPLLAEGKPVGVVFFSSRQPGVYREEHALLLRRLAGALAVSVEKELLIETLRQRNRELLEANALKERFLDELRRGQDCAGLTGAGKAMTRVREAVGQVAGTDSTVLILGETGTGKELVARAVHEASPRHAQLLVKVNCAALAPGVLASELFGHEAGSFTGATKRRVGRFELADGGSIFLDEVAEVQPETQVMLLRVLQERVIERVGGNEPVPVDVRVIAATNRDLAAAVAEGPFRADLFYRLNVFPVRVPPLRERPEDIPALIEHFIGRFNRRMNRRVRAVGRRTLELLTAYRWPGNVRELENLVERAMIVTGGDVLEVDPTWLAGPAAPEAAADAASLGEVERRTILDALERCGGKVYGPGGAAAALGLKPTTLYGKMRKHGIRKRPGSPSFE